MSSAGEISLIYSHLLELCKYRGAQIVRQVAPAVGIQEMGAEGFTRIEAERSGDPARVDARIIIILFAPTRGIDSSAHRFGTFLDRLLHEKGEDPREFDVIFVTFGTVSSTIASAISMSRPGYHLEQHPTTRFHVVAPSHLCVPRHEIATAEEVAHMRDELHVSVRNMPQLIASGEQPDPMAVWLDLRPGMIIKITRPCENSGLEIVYRRCV